LKPSFGPDLQVGRRQGDELNRSSKCGRRACLIGFRADSGRLLA
jgi:hypothetical protein